MGENNFVEEKICRLQREKDELKMDNLKSDIKNINRIVERTMDEFKKDINEIGANLTEFMSKTMTKEWVKNEIDERLDSKFEEHYNNFENKKIAEITRKILFKVIVTGLLCILGTGLTAYFTSISEKKDVVKNERGVEK